MNTHAVHDGYDKCATHSTVLTDTYKGFLAMSLPLLAAAWIRMPYIEHPAQMLMTLVGPVALLIVHILKATYSYKARAWSIIIITYVMGMTELILFGIVSLGALLLLVSCILSAMFVERRGSIIIETVSFVSFLLVMFLSNSKVLPVQINTESFIMSYDAWISQLAVIVLIAATIVLGIRRLNVINRDYALQIIGNREEIISGNMQLSAMDLELQNKYDELQKSRNAIMESELKYRTLFDSMSDYVYMLDLDGRFEAVNNVFIKTFNISEEDILGKTLYEILPHPEGNAIWNEVLNRVKETKSKVIQFNSFVDRDGNPKTYEVTLIPIIHEDKVHKIIGTSTMFRKSLNRKKESSTSHIRMN